MIYLKRKKNIKNFTDILQFTFDVRQHNNFSDITKFINSRGRFECPHIKCYKNYKDASSLQRHIR